MGDKDSDWLIIGQPIPDSISVKFFSCKRPCHWHCHYAPDLRLPIPKTSHQHKSTYKILGKRDVAQNTSLTCCHETFVRISNNLCQSLDSDSLINRAASQCVDNLTVNFITYSTWHILAIASPQLLFPHSVTTPLFIILLWPRKVNIRRIYPSSVTWAVCDLSRGESLMYSWSGTVGLLRPGWPGNTHPGRDWSRPGHVINIMISNWSRKDRHRSRQTGMMKAAAADVFFSQCDFYPVTFKWHRQGVLWWNTHTL